MSDSSGRMCNGSRAVSRHAEVRCLDNYRCTSKNKNNIVITSLAFSIQRDHEGCNHTIKASCGKPCRCCSEYISRKNITKVRYSDDYGNVVKIRTNDLLKTATYSLGSRLMMSLFIPRLYIRSERTFELLKSGLKTVEVRLTRGFINSIENDTNILISHRSETVSMHVTKKRMYSSFRNLLNKEGIGKVLPDHSNLICGIRHLNQYWFKGNQKNSKHNIIAIHLVLC